MEKNFDMNAYKNIDNTKLKRLLVDCINYAMDKSHEYVTTEHLLLYCLKDKDVRTIFKKWIQDDDEETIDLIEAHLQTNMEKTVPKVNHEAIPELSTTVSSALSDVIVEVYKDKEFKSVEPWHIFKYIVENQKSDFFDELLTVNFSDVIYDKTLDEIIEELKTELKETSDKNIKEFKKQEIMKIIEELATDMVEMADEYDPIIGREKEIFFIEKTMCRRLKNNVIIVGHPGVGKTAIVEGLAKYIKEGNVPKKLKNARIYSISVSNLIAGTKYRGEFENKVKTLLTAFEELFDTGEYLPIVFIDEIHMIMGAGSSSEDKNTDLANILKPFLTKGKIRFIGATTYDEYQKHIEKDNALKRRFQVLKIDEPSPEEAKRILRGLINRFEEFHNVKYSEEAIDAAVDYTTKYVTKQFLPDKAIDIIDIVGARRNLNETYTGLIKDDEIVSEISEIVKIPREKLEEKKENNLVKLEKELKNHIFGQDHVIDEVVDTIYVSRAGLKEGTKPDGIFFFNGPTGTGKTELAKVLAKSLNMGFHRIDMSEFMEQHSVAKLIGPPPGYVGFDQTEGILYKIIEENAYSVILLDEIEKAHPSVWNILLQIFDYGKITTSKGKDVFFGNTIFIMTGNIGSRYINKMEIGFGKGSKGEEIQEEELKRLFPPELLNRIDAILTFKPLSKEVCEKIIMKFIKELEDKLCGKNIKISIDDKAIGYLLDKGFDQEMGARPLRRIIDKKVKKLIARKIIENEEKIRKIKISLDDNDEICCLTG